MSAQGLFYMQVVPSLRRLQFKQYFDAPEMGHIKQT